MRSIQLIPESAHPMTLTITGFERTEVRFTKAGCVVSVTESDGSHTHSYIVDKNDDRVYTRQVVCYAGDCTRELCREP